MKKTIDSSGSYNATSIRNSVRLVLWSLGYAVSLIAFGLIYRFYSASLPLAIVLILIHIMIGFGLVAAYIRNVKQADELEREILLVSMAMASGAAVIGCVTHVLLDIMNLDFYDTGDFASFLILLMVFVQAVGIIISKVKYR